MIHSEKRKLGRRLEERVTGTFTFGEFEEIYKRLSSEGEVEIHERADLYKRYTYPELFKREKEVAELVGVEGSEVVLYNSGMAAIRDVVESNDLTKGDVVLYSPFMYPETVKYIEEDLGKRGIRAIPIDPSDMENIERKIDFYHPKILIAETIGNALEMPVLDIEKLLKKVEEINEKYEKQLSLSTILSKHLLRRSWIKKWLKIDRKLTQEQEDKLINLIKEFEKTARKINEIQSYMPLRFLVRKLEELKVEIGDRRRMLLELKSIIDTAWLAKREKPLKLILDNTLPTPTALPLGEEIKKWKSPVIVVESGTKFYAKNIGTMGIAYSNSSEEILRLKLLRMRTGTYLPGAVENILPEFSKEEFEIRNKRILRNTKLLAETFARLKGKIGIKAIYYPNLPEHPNYEYVSEKFPGGASPIFYLLCKDALETARYLAKKLGNMIDFGGSFGLEKTRLLPLPGGILRIAGGNESLEKVEELINKIMEISKESKS